MPIDFECYRKFVDSYQKECAAPNGENGDDLGVEIDEYTMKWFFHFVEACESTGEVDQ